MFLQQSKISVMQVILIVLKYDSAMVSSVFDVVQYLVLAGCVCAYLYC